MPGGVHPTFAKVWPCLSLSMQFSHVGGSGSPTVVGTPDSVRMYSHLTLSLFAQVLSCLTLFCLLATCSLPRVTGAEIALADMVSTVGISTGLTRYDKGSNP